MRLTGDTRCGNLLDQLKDSSHLGWEEYTHNLSSTYELLVINYGHIYHKRRQKVGKRGGTYGPNIMFAQKVVSHEMMVDLSPIIYLV